ncbi:MAG: nucleoside deaminase [Oscillospiraceae bacterium]|nr:nucleoside deaminase [Oscillospiraceae bacterium]
MDLERWMDEALSLAREAGQAGEVPVGCVVVRDGEILGRGRNRREEERSALAHAEMEAIREACARLGDWRLEGCALFVTLEPCAMCAGAILNARIPTVVYGLREGKTGACGSVLDLFAEDFGFRPRMYGGVREAECRDLMQDFFSRLRE